MADRLSCMSASGSVYHELDGPRREIRLLAIHPSRDLAAQVQCSLEVVSLDDDPVFEALSYAWGDATLNHEILVNCGVFHTTGSAGSALQALRSQDNRRVLWIDAICINQSNLIERSDQVKLMGSIYGTAKTVRVWLGIEELEDIGVLDVFKALTSLQGASDTFKSVTEPNEHILAKMCHFLGRSWWQRFWVVQEVALGQHVVFQLGVESIEFHELLLAHRICTAYFGGKYSTNSYSRAIRIFMTAFDNIEVLDLVHHICVVNKISMDPRMERYAIMLWTAIANILRVRKTTDDRDRMYALFGLLPPGFVRRTKMNSSYSSTPEQIFIDVTYHIISSSKSRMMFNYLDGPRIPLVSRSHSGLPSWVPDWRTDPANELEGSTFRVERDVIFSASGDSAFSLKRLSSNTLCLQGIFIDIVLQCFRSESRCQNDSHENYSYAFWREKWASFQNLPLNKAMSQSYLPGMNADAAFRKTVLLDCEPNLGAGKGHKRLTAEDSEEMFRVHELFMQSEYEHKSDAQNFSGADLRRLSYMKDCVRDRSFVITTSGLMGMAQGYPEPGDHIFAVAGNSHPVILRPSEFYADTWLAVGECHVTGLMYGEIMPHKKHFSDLQQNLYARSEVQNIKGGRRNPRWEEVSAKPDDPWEWLLVE
ncbi:uncharacterized protein RCO7_10408 [Rhynchosporium graminicola]|uniref:Heterokaryon incompatibility domain-containing protein n=1 Tax=Rhynchosporium graminicola TaxID=2792576 RepID=A0A1E1L7K3_9HELO|nr:uncharacterized protein RCO7_10408 [Rhynchosporium commune]